MDTLIWVLFILLVAAAAWWVWNRERSRRKTLLENGFVQETKSPPEVAEICQLLFDAAPQPEFLLGQIEDRWGRDTWLVSVDPGGDQPMVELLTFEVSSASPSRFVLVPTVRISKTGGIVGSLLNIAPPFRKAGLRLLPDEYQPFLSRRKGWLVFSDREFHVEQTLPYVVVKQLRKPESHFLGGFAMLESRVALWTPSRSRLSQMLEWAMIVRVNC